jgi:hypothetical protein
MRSIQMGSGACQPVDTVLFHMLARFLLDHAHSRMMTIGKGRSHLFGFRPNHRHPARFYLDAAHARSMTTFGEIAAP